MSLLVDLTVEIGPAFKELCGWALMLLLFATTLHTMGKLFGK